MVDLERGAEFSQVSGLRLTLLPSREHAGGERADHLGNVDASDLAVLELRDCQTRKIPDQFSRAAADRLNVDRRVELAVERGEIGGVGQQRQSANLPEF